MTVLQFKIFFFSNLFLLLFSLPLWGQQPTIRMADDGNSIYIDSDTGLQYTAYYTKEGYRKMTDYYDEQIPNQSETIRISHVKGRHEHISIFAIDVEGEVSTQIFSLKDGIYPKESSLSITKRPDNAIEIKAPNYLAYDALFTKQGYWGIDKHSKRDESPGTTIGLDGVTSSFITVAAIDLEGNVVAQKISLKEQKGLSEVPSLDDIKNYYEDDKIRTELIPDKYRETEDAFVGDENKNNSMWFFAKISFVWDLLKDNFELNPEEDHTWVDTGLRSKFAMITKYATTEILEKIATYPIYTTPNYDGDSKHWVWLNTIEQNRKLAFHLKPFEENLKKMWSPHGGWVSSTPLKMNYNSTTSFGKYNPSFLCEMTENYQYAREYFPFFKKIIQPLYDKHLKGMAHTYYDAYLYLNRDRESLEDLQTQYLSDVFAEGGTTNGSMQEIFRDYAEALEQNKGADYYEAVTAPAFWLRRSIDGTDELFIEMLEMLMKDFDPEFIPVRDFVDFSTKNRYYDGYTLKDPRDGQVYRVTTLKDGKVWMIDNLNYYLDGSYYPNNRSITGSINGYQFGRLYSREAAKKAYPPGWHLPTDDELWNLFNYYVKPFNSIDDGKIGHKDPYYSYRNDDVERYNFLQSTYFQLAGEYNYLYWEPDTKFSPMENVFLPDGNGVIWSATDKPEYSIVYKFNLGSLERTYSHYDQEAAYSCRCVKD